MKEIFMPKAEDLKQIPESELDFDFANAGGPGGQNVNKVNTKAIVSWNIDKSKAFTDAEKQRIKEYYAGRKCLSGSILSAYSVVTRSQTQNKKLAVGRLNEFVAEALKIEKERIPTKPTYGSQERRIEEKKHQGEKKKMREKFRV